MPSVAKTIELSAESPDSFEDAVRVGIAKAGETSTTSRAHTSRNRRRSLPTGWYPASGST